MSHGEFDIVDVELVVTVEPTDVVEVNAEIVDVAVVLLEVMGPPGEEGPPGTGIPGPPGPMDPGLPDHINSELPHPVYDDGASFTLLYENAKV